MEEFIYITEFYGYNKFRSKLHIKCILVICICYYDLMFIAESVITEAQNDALCQLVSNKKYWCLVKMSEKLV